MANPFHELRERLLRAGVAPRHVRRYLSELADHLADLRTEEERRGLSRADAGSAALLRLGGIEDLASAIIDQRQFQAWCVRAPWAIFGLAPLLTLTAAWFLALFILWSGWHIFLPGADTPFGVQEHGLANLYFQFGKAVYLGAPILLGWAVGLVAARQRLKAAWPAVGLMLIAWMGGTGQVQASRTAVSGKFGHVRMDFVVGSFAHRVPDGLVHALVILSITVLPYLIWRWHISRSVSA